MPRRPHLLRAFGLAAAHAVAWVAGTATAQGLIDPQRQQRIEAIDVRIVNPSPDAALNARLEDLVRRTLAAFPSDRYSEERVAVSLARARRNADIADVSHTALQGPTGGIVLKVEVQLSEPGAGGAPRGALAGGGAEAFPVLYDVRGTFLRAKVEMLGMAYANADAWYGRPDALLAGNPFVVGQPAGAGGSGWGEGFVHAGLYGITPLTGSLHAYGGISAIASGSSGQELFTDSTRSYAATEDAYAGVVGGVTTDAGNRFVYTLSAGRQRFAIGDGFLLVNTATNGLGRAALQSNPRWAADQLLAARAAYNDLRAEVFSVDPDELPEIDTRTRIDGINVESVAWQQLEWGVTALRARTSSYAYYTPEGVLGRRQGLRVLDARLRWQPAPAGLPGPFVAAEIAQQSHSDFAMRARAGSAEGGYIFAAARWSPTVSYRYARFSGDDPATTRFERWDPLLSGGNGETWVQGINHFKLFQNSNLVTHRLQARLRPVVAVELVPQLWWFRADSTTNLGGNPALSQLSSRDLGVEANVTAKYFASAHVMFQGHVAATFARSAVEQALGPLSSPWLSVMAFARIGF